MSNINNYMYMPNLRHILYNKYICLWSNKIYKILKKELIMMLMLGLILLNAFPLEMFNQYFACVCLASTMNNKHTFRICSLYRKHNPVPFSRM